MNRVGAVECAKVHQSAEILKVPRKGRRFIVQRSEVENRVGVADETLVRVVECAGVYKNAVIVNSGLVREDSWIVNCPKVVDDCLWVVRD